MMANDLQVRRRRRCLRKGAAAAAAVVQWGQSILLTVSPIFIYQLISRLDWSGHGQEVIRN